MKQEFNQSLNNRDYTQHYRYLGENQSRSSGSDSIESEFQKAWVKKSTFTRAQDERKAGFGQIKKRKRPKFSLLLVDKELSSYLVSFQEQLHSISH